jgi:hypothetical protein
VLADPVWQRVFELAGVVSRGESANILGKTWPNTGVLVFNIDSNPKRGNQTFPRATGLSRFKAFLDAWIAVTDKTFYWLNGLKQDIYFTETLSFLLALIETNVPYELLPVQLNCQLNMPLLDFQRNGYIDTLVHGEVPAIVHYPLQTIPFDKFGYVGAFTPAAILQQTFPFINRGIPLNHINQFYLQQGGTPFFSGSPMGVDFHQDIVINPIIGPYCNPLIKRYDLYWGENVNVTFLSIANGHVNEGNYRNLLKDMALYCQSPRVWVDWYDINNNYLRRLINAPSDLILAIKQTVGHRLNSHSNTADDAIVLDLFVTGQEYDSI